MAEHEPRIAVSFGGTHPAEITKTAKMEWAEFVALLTAKPPEAADKASRGWYACAEFSQRYRDSDYLVARTALTFDFDEVTPADVRAVAAAYSDAAYVLYTTASHTAEKPRLRMVLPLSRPAKIDEFQAVSRKVAAVAGIELASRESHVPGQMMYLPTIKRGGEFKSKVNAGNLIDVDAVLASYEDWTDRARWPKRKDRDGVHSYEGTTTPPREKPGIVGDFCRAFDVFRAIERFDLPYEETADPERMTYTAGSRPEGAIVYDDGQKLHSHHDTDPARGQHNSFDLVRLHRFHDLDEGYEGPITQAPSYRAMCALALEQPEVRSQIAEDEFEDLGPLVEEEVIVGKTEITDRFRVYPAEEFSSGKSIEWHIKGVLPRAELAVVYGESGSGKAQPLDEPVLTPEGWRPMGEIAPGEYVIGSSGFPIKVLAVHPQPAEEEWRVTFSDGTVVRCGGSHLWRVQVKGVFWQVLSTAELDARAGTRKGRRNYRVPLMGPVQYTPSGDPLPLDPYVLGALLGDGNITNFVAFASGDEEVLAEIRARLPAGHKLSGVSGGSYAYRVYVPRGQRNYVWMGLRLLGLAGHKSSNKFIPKEYLRASPAERLLLLQGLMDTDGYVANGGGKVVEVAFSCKQLAEDTHELVGSLGGIACPIRVRQTTGLDSYRFGFRLPPGMSAFRLSRKAERLNGADAVNRRMETIERTGRAVPMQCLSVAAPDQCYVTTGFTVTHNSFLGLDLTAAISRGVSWRERKTRKGRGVYVASEGAGGFKGRLRAYAEKNTVDLRELPSVIADAPNLMDPKDATLIAKQILLAGGADVIVIDTLSASFAGNENSGEDVGQVLRHCKFLHQKTGALVILIHHSGKDAAKGARGWSGLRAAADAEIEVTRNGEFRAAKITKMKDGMDGAQFPFQLETLQLGVDEDGEPQTSCVVVHANESQAERTRMPRGANQILVYGVLKDLASDGAAVSVTDLITACAKRKPYDSKGGKKDMRRRDMNRALDKLIAEDFVFPNRGGDSVSLLRGNVESADSFDEVPA